MANFSFDIVSEVDLQEVDNAVNQAKKETAQRYDFKNTKFSIDYNREEKKITLVAADDFYKGRRFYIEGEIAEINTDIFGNPYVTLKGGVNQFMEPQFSFNGSEKAKIISLRKNQQILLECKGNGDIAKTPMLDECLLIQ